MSDEDKSLIEYIMKLFNVSYDAVKMIVTDKIERMINISILLFQNL